MKQFFKEMLTGVGNVISSKRVAFIAFAVVFLAEIPLSAIWQKTADVTLRDQLFYAMLYFGGLVFGERAIGPVKAFFSSGKTADAFSDAPDNK